MSVVLGDIRIVLQQHETFECSEYSVQSVEKVQWSIGAEEEKAMRNIQPLMVANRTLNLPRCSPVCLHEPELYRSDVLGQSALSAAGQSVSTIAVT